MKYTHLQKGYFWEIMGLFLLFGIPGLLVFFLECNPLDDCDEIHRDSKFLTVYTLTMWFSLLMAPISYVVGAIHLLISAAPWWHRLLAVFLPIVGLVLLN